MKVSRDVIKQTLLRMILISNDQSVDISKILEYIDKEITELSELTDNPESKKIIKVQKKYSDLINGDLLLKTYKGSGYVLDTLCFAVQTILRYDNFKSAVVYAANTAVDNDTVAVITAAIESLYYKDENYNPPIEWSQDIRNKQLIDDYINAFVPKM